MAQASTKTDFTLLFSLPKTTNPPLYQGDASNNPNPFINFSADTGMNPYNVI